MKTFLSQLRARRRRLVSTGVSVILGVAFLVAALSFGSTLGRGFEAMFKEANKTTAVVVRSKTLVGSNHGGQRNTIPATVADTVRAVPGVAEAATGIQTSGQLLDRNGEGVGGNGPPTFAGNWIADPRLNPYRIVDGRAPRDLAPGEPYEVVIDRNSANKAGYKPGDHAKVVLPDPVNVVIVGIAAFGSGDSMGPVTFTGFAPKAASTLLSTGPGGDQIDMIRVAAEPGTSPEELRQSIARSLPAGIEALTGAQLTAEQIDDINGDFLDLFRAMLTTFGVIAVVVAAVSIYNTFSIVVAQRARESALLRAIGASRRQVLTMVVAESLTIGVIASLIGLAAGFGLSSLLQWVMASTGAIDLGDLSTVLDTSTIVTGLAVGIGVTLLASLGPAIRSARTAPVDALRSADAETRRLGRLRIAIGVVLAGAGATTVVLATRSSDNALMISAMGALLVLAGALVLAPVAVRPAAMILGAPGAVRGQTQGKLARQNVLRNPRRTANAAAALMIGVTVVAVFATFGASLTASVERMVNRNFGGDLVISSVSQFDGGFSATAASQVAELPEVAHSVNLALGSVRVGDDDQFASVVDAPSLAKVLDVEVSSGSMEAVTSGTIAISSQYAREHDLAVGSPSALTFPDGSSTQVRVAAVYADRMTMGDVMINAADAAPHLRVMPIVAVLIDLRPGVTEQDGAAAVNRVTAPYSMPKAQTRSEYVESIASQVDDMLAFIYGLLGVAVLIAVMSIANTLALSIHERTREIGLLRAVGQSRRQVRSMIRKESVIVSVFGATIGAGLGLFCGWGLMRAMAVQEGIGLFTAPVTTLVIVVGLAVAAGIMAAMRPARRAARIGILSAIAGSEDRAAGATT